MYKHTSIDLSERDESALYRTNRLGSAVVAITFCSVSRDGNQRELGWLGVLCRA